MATDSNVPARPLLVGCLTLFIIGTDLFAVSPGLALFVAANLLTGYVPSFAWLLASRMIAGLAAAMVSPSIYAITGDVAPPANAPWASGRTGQHLVTEVQTGLSLYRPLWDGGVSDLRVIKGGVI